MPRLTKAVPKYSKHRGTGQAVVSINGKDFYLGPYGTKASHREYDRLVGEWQANGRRLVDSGLTIAELLVEYRKHVRVHYVKNGRATDEQACIASAMRILREMYADAPATEFGPLALKNVREKMIQHGFARRTINSHVHRIRRMFTWGVANELVPVEIVQALKTLPGLERGKTTAHEPEPIGPIDDATVEATIPALPAVVADMVRFQRLTGCRPEEVCKLRPCDVDASDTVWLYRPEEHKMEHKGRSRVVCIGPKAQDILRPYLLREKTAFCFSPADSERKRRDEQHEARMTPLSYGNTIGTCRVAKPRRKPGEFYTTDSYRRAIRRAVEAINKKRLRTGERPLEVWAPNRLRHSAATMIRKAFGLEAAQVALGHAACDVTQVYAERDLAKAAAVMAEVG